MTNWRSSTTRTKSKGDRGSPCLTPLLHLNYLPGVPFKRIEEKPEVKITDIHCNHLPGKPICFMIWMTSQCSMVSKALAKSSFRIIISFLLWWHWWMYSKHHAMQSWIVLLLIKPYWFLCKSCRITLCSLSAKILVNNFMLQFRSDIGKKSFTISGLLS